MATDVVALYAATRARIAGIVADLGPEDLDRPVPACPGWSVHDLVSHVAFSAADVLAGNLAGAPGDAWTAAQLERGRGRPAAEVVAGWLAQAPAYDAFLSQAPEPLRGTPAIDLVTHEHDLRGAIDRPGSRDDPAVQFALRRYAIGWGLRLTEAGLPGARVAAGDGPEYVVGDGEPGVTVAAPAYELFRALAGRRSRDQVLGFDWTGDLGAPLDLFPTFGRFAAEKIVE